MTALAKIEEYPMQETSMFTREKLDLLKATICKDSTDDEFQLFIHACKRSGLDPFMKQVYAVKRWDNKLKREAMTIQTGIDGYRLIAERTGRYCPGKSPTYEYDNKGQILSATAFVKKQTKDGTWHEVEATAYWDEYCQKNKEGQPTSMWKNMPRNQLAKCAESLAIRKCFPAELSGIYTKEEMEQSEVIEVKQNEIKQVGVQPAAYSVEKPKPEVKKPTKEEIDALVEILSECDPAWVEEKKIAMTKANANFVDWPDIKTVQTYIRIYDLASQHRKEYMLQMMGDDHDLTEENGNN